MDADELVAIARVSSEAAETVVRTLVGQVNALDETLGLQRGALRDAVLQLAPGDPAARIALAGKVATRRGAGGYEYIALEDRPND